MCDPYEKQLLMIAVQNASFVGRLHGNGPALAPPLPCSIRAVAHAVVKPVTVCHMVACGDPTKVALATCANCHVMGCVGPCVTRMKSNS